MLKTMRLDEGPKWTKDQSICITDQYTVDATQNWFVNTYVVYVCTYNVDCTI